MATQPEDPRDDGFLPVPPPGTESLKALEAKLRNGLAGGEDLAFLTVYRAAATSSPSADETLESWSKSYGTSSTCYWISVPTGQGSGTYSLQIFAGPSLVEASNEVNVRVGA